MNKQSLAQQKALAVIKSCETLEQLEVTRLYIYFYYQSFKDLTTYLNLMVEFKSHPLFHKS